MKLSTTKLITLVVATLTTMAEICKNPVTRKEIRELSPSELENLTTAMAKLHLDIDVKTGLSKHEEFAKIHNENVSVSHEVPAFLAWHRHFIREYEKALQKIDSRVVLPYWDWSLDSQAPQDSILFTEKYVGGNGNRASGYCMENGPFKGWNMSYPFKHCLKRSFNLGNKITPLSYPEEVSLYLNEPTFSKFSLLFEEKHGYPHLFIGGPVGDFNPTYSPNDPIFFLHHAFVDYVWFQWQYRHESAKQYEGINYYNSGEVDESDTLAHYNNVKISSLIDTRDEYYCYTYDLGYPRFIYPDNISARHKKEVEDSIKDNIILSGALKNATMSQALDYLKNKYNENKPANGLEPVRTPGILNKDWAAIFGFSMPEQLEKNSGDSILLAKHLNRVPRFKSLAFFSKYLKQHYNPNHRCPPPLYKPLTY